MNRFKKVIRWFHSHFTRQPRSADHQNFILIIICCASSNENWNCFWCFEENEAQQNTPGSREMCCKSVLSPWMIQYPKTKNFQLLFLQPKFPSKHKQFFVSHYFIGNLKQKKTSEKGKLIFSLRKTQLELRKNFNLACSLFLKCVPSDFN
jgi:hypothetical protein